MRDSRIRVLLHKGLEPHETKAANDAAGRFGRFGLRTETINGSLENVWMDLCRRRVCELVFKDAPIMLHGEEPLGRPDYFSKVPNDGAMLAAIVPQRILHNSGGKKRELEGFNLYFVGAVVSASPFKPGAGTPYRSGGAASISESAAAMELCLAHELGHALLGSEPIMKSFVKKGEPKRYDDDGHCTAPGCLMQNITDYVAHVRALTSQRIDFCDGCADLLKGRVTTIQWHAAGGC